MNSFNEGVHRRDFLVLGSAGLAALCFGGAAEAQSLVTAEVAPRPMPVGFLTGSEEVASSLRKLPARIRRPRMAAEAGSAISEYVVVPAESLPLGDTNLIGSPLRLTIHGLYPPGGISPKRWAELPLAIDLDVLFPSPDPMSPDPIRFFAWSFRRRPGWNPSPPVSFVFPLDWQALPELAMRVVPAGGGPVRTFRTKFTFDDETGQPRLLRGAYVLGTAPNAWRRNVALRALGPDTPASFVSVLVSMEPEPAE
jgi:hypothetical protein